MKMILPDKIYNIIKWICAIVSPASCTLLVTLNGLWQWGLPIEAIVGTITAITTFAGVVLGISNVNYKRVDSQ